MDISSISRDDNRLNTARSIAVTDGEKSEFSDKMTSAVSHALGLTRNLKTEDETQMGNSWMDTLDRFIEKARNNDKGLFGSIKSKDVNWDADGSCELTEEQADYLRSKYHMLNIDEGSYEHMLAELTHMNVISSKDFLSHFVAPIGQGMMACLSATSSIHKRAFGFEHESGNIMDAISIYKKNIREMKNWIFDNYMALGKDKFYYLKEYWDEEEERTGRLHDIFMKLC